MAVLILVSMPGHSEPRFGLGLFTLLPQLQKGKMPCLLINERKGFKAILCVNAFCVEKKTDCKTALVLSLYPLTNPLWPMLQSKSE